ncbi:MAG: ThuA domain-containing protein, partial [Lentisphaeria bacterium]|nr:ThuA domain-containing protein [Lentisphaeria bacterium]
MRIETLLVTGENNHDWARSAPFCVDLLQGTGKFSVDLTDQPSQALADPANLSRYQLIFIDYNGSDWDPAAKDNFVDCVRNGAGVCILHAANNGFVGWKAFEEMCAVVW